MAKTATTQPRESGRFAPKPEYQDILDIEDQSMDLIANCMDLRKLEYFQLKLTRIVESISEKEIKLADYIEEQARYLNLDQQKRRRDLEPRRPCATQTNIINARNVKVRNG